MTDTFVFFPVYFTAIAASVRWCNEIVQVKSLARLTQQ